MKPTAELIALVNQTPDLDRQGKVHGKPWAECLPIYEGILKMGRDGILQPIGMLAAIDDGTDYKARYTLHAIVIHVGHPEKAKERKLVADALSSELGGDAPKAVQGYLTRQLQLIGDQSHAKALGAQLLDDENWEYAAQALLAIREGAVDQFRSALDQVEGPKLLTVVQALGVLADAPSAKAIRKYLGDKSLDLRITTAWALAEMNDAQSAEDLLLNADKAGGWERSQLTKACLILAENLKAAGDGKGAAAIYSQLKKTRTDPAEAFIREAASKRLSLAAVQDRAHPLDFAGLNWKLNVRVRLILEFGFFVLG